MTALRYAAISSSVSRYSLVSYLLTSMAILLPAFPREFLGFLYIRLLARLIATNEEEKYHLLRLYGPDSLGQYRI